MKSSALEVAGMSISVPAILGFLRRMALITAGIGAAVLAIDWIFLGWRAAAEFGRGLQYGGAAAVVVGAASVLGPSVAARDFSYQQGATVSKASLEERTRQRMMKARQGLYELYVLLLVAAICGGIGALMELLG